MVEFVSGALIEKVVAMVGWVMRDIFGGYLLK